MSLKETSGSGPHHALCHISPLVSKLIDATITAQQWSLLMLTLQQSQQNTLYNRTLRLPNTLVSPHPKGIFSFSMTSENLTYLCCPTSQVVNNE